MNRIYVVIMSLFIISCGQKAYLTNDDIKWNPYQKGDVLIYQSSGGAIDTLKIADVLANQFPSAEHPLKYYFEILEVKLDGNRDLIEIHAETPKLASDIFFTFSLGEYNEDMNSNKISQNIRFYSDIKNRYKLNDLEKKVVFETFVNGKRYSDIIEIESNSKLWEKRYHFATKMIWSKKYGCIKITRKDGLYWELTKFYRDSKDLLKMSNSTSTSSPSSF